MGDLYLSSSTQHCKLLPATPANHQDISGGYGSFVIIQLCKKSKCRGETNLEVRIYGEILRVLQSERKKTQQKQRWNLQESLSANPISHCLIDFWGFVTGGRQGWDFTTQDLEAFLESSSIALKMALKESLASCNLISSTDFTLKPCLSMSRIQVINSCAYTSIWVPDFWVGVFKFIVV